MEEIWKDIKGFDGYQVSNIGNLRRIYVISVSKNSTGYKQAGLSIDGKVKLKLIHRLVAIAFLDDDDDREEVNHINGIRDDNRAENLEWCTRSENIKHSYRMGHRTYKKPSLDKHKVRIIKALLRIGEKQKHIAKLFGVSSTHISNINTGRFWNNS